MGRPRRSNRPNKSRKHSNKSNQPSQFNQSFTKNAQRFGTNYDIEAVVIHDMGIPDRFPKAVEDEVAEIVAKQSDPSELLKDPAREDLTHIPFVTIDGEDARDFDDAVYAHADKDPKNKGGHILWVAIADVAHYVRAGSALDKEARERGTSVYFPSMVVPMLPEELSNGICSLKPNEHRACMAYKIKVSADGKVLDRELHQGVMKSQARLTYTQVLAAIEGKLDSQTKPIFDKLLKPLHKVYKSLAINRAQRDTIDFGYGEISVRNDKKKNKQPEFHQINGDEARSLIEEAMIAANISAGRDQTEKCDQGVYRVQDKPKAKNKEIIKTLKQLGVKSAGKHRSGQGLTQKDFNKMLSEAENSLDPHMARGMILRMQDRAIYTTDNKGHFCLALPEYTHFTSPIRRYPDLLAHRKLKDAFNFHSDPKTGSVKGDLKHCSYTERRAKKASKEVNKQYTMRYLYNMQGQDLSAEIIDISDKRGVRFKVKGCNYQANIDMRSLPHGRYSVNNDRDAIVNQDTGHVFKIGEKMDVTIHFANLTGDEDTPVMFLVDADQALPQKPRRNGGPKGQKPQP